MIFRVHDKRHHQSKRRAEHRQADVILPAVRDRPLRQDFLQFTGGDQAPGKCQRADNYLEPDFRHLELRHVGRGHIIFRDPDERRGERAERVAQRGPLRHGSHLHHAKRNAHARADNQRDQNPFVLADLRIEQRGGHGQRRGNLADQNPAHGRYRRTQPFQRQDEANCRHYISGIDELLSHGTALMVSSPCRS